MGMSSENIFGHRCQMRAIGIVMLLSASLCFAQGSSDFKPASSNVLDAQFPQVDSSSRVQIRLRRPMRPRCGSISGAARKRTWRSNRTDSGLSLQNPWCPAGRGQASLVIPGRCFPEIKGEPVARKKITHATVTRRPASLLRIPPTVLNDILCHREQRDVSEQLILS